MSPLDKDDLIVVLASALEGLVSAIDNGITTEGLIKVEEYASAQPQSTSSLLREARLALGAARNS